MGIRIIEVLLYIHGRFGGDFNLVVCQFCLQLPNLMHPNTKYGHMYYEGIIYTQYCSVRQTKCPVICIIFQFTKLHIHHIYHVYSINSIIVDNSIRPLHVYVHTHHLLNNCSQ